MFKHVETGHFLASTAQQYSRPISGHFEVASMPNTKSDATQWKAGEGVYSQTRSPHDLNPPHHGQVIDASLEEVQNKPLKDILSAHQDL